MRHCLSNLILLFKNRHNHHSYTPSNDSYDDYSDLLNPHQSPSPSSTSTTSTTTNTNNVRTRSRLRSRGGAQTEGSVDSIQPNYRSRSTRGFLHSSTESGTETKRKRRYKKRASSKQAIFSHQQQQQQSQWKAKEEEEIGFSKEAANPPLPQPFHLPTTKNVYNLCDSKEEEQEVCPICLEEYCEVNPKVEGGCHEFHLQCALAWRERSQFCPICGCVLKFGGIFDEDSEDY